MNLWKLWKREKRILHEQWRKCKRIVLIPFLKPLGNKKNSPQYIVSLTSYGMRLTHTAPYAIITIFNQRVKPDKIVLWVGHKDKENIPKIMEKLTRKGLEIRFCEDMRSYTKLIPALETFSKDYIITVDDDVFYPRNWFEQLLATHKENPGKIICHRAHGMKVDENHDLLSYNQWSNCDGQTIRKNLFPTGVGGILYPPKCFHNDIKNRELFMKLTPYADDIWFWAMALINKDHWGEEYPYIVIENGYSIKLRDIDTRQTVNENALRNNNVDQNGNDRQLKAVIEYYPQIREMLKKIKSIEPDLKE
ncbi:MAG: glycosyltransferase family 2 protein [Candidatus Azobacteroides sp.]|nr:glycosyltransferase family 2 protein [Candidatus Azobacteroides sp.]